MPIRLDKRLSLIASLVDFGTVADVGCDHGKLSYYLVSTDKASRAIAADISRGSLEKARKLAAENGVEGLMDTRLGDGLEHVGDREADTVVIAGLGGDVISEILQAARDEGKGYSHFVLSPNTHAEKVRRELACWRHTIVYDDTVECSGKEYAVIKTDEGDFERLSEAELLFGKFYATNENFKKRAAQELAFKTRLLADNPSSEGLTAQVDALKAALGEK